MSPEWSMVSFHSLPSKAHYYWRSIPELMGTRFAGWCIVSGWPWVIQPKVFMTCSQLSELTEWNMSWLCETVHPLLEVLLDPSARVTLRLSWLWALCPPGPLPSLKKKKKERNIKNSILQLHSHNIIYENNFFDLNLNFFFRLKKKIETFYGPLKVPSALPTSTNTKMKRKQRSGRKSQASFILKLPFLSYVSEKRR